MAEPRAGDRFRLLLYERALARYRRPTFFLAILQLGLWLPVDIGMVAWPPPPAAGWLLAGGAVSLLAWLFVWLAPRLAYVQAHRDHLRLQTPIYRLKISYRRIHNTRPVDVVKMFPPREQQRSRLQLLQPFYGGTALGVDLRGYPVSPGVLRAFFGSFILARDQPGLVLIVPDWMKLSQQLSTRMDAWRAARPGQRQAYTSSASAILAEEQKRRRWWER